jgi:hypothetical protein
MGERARRWIARWTPPKVEEGPMRASLRSTRTRVLTLSIAAVLAWSGSALGAQGGVKGGSAFNMEVVGQSSLGARGFNADVWVHDSFAYVGSWGFADWTGTDDQDRFCPESPGNGIAVVDATDPEHPTMVSRLASPDGTSAEDVVVFTAPFGPSAGRDIAVAGIQTCGGSHNDLSIERGMMLWDVTDPANPFELGFWDAECCARGVHEFEVEHREDLGRTFAYVSVPESRLPVESSPSGYRDITGDGDFRLIDITDPANPFQASSWGIEDIGGPWSAGLGCDPAENYGHGAEPSADGTEVFFAYWDAGFVRLDLTDPETPVFISRTEYPSTADGQAHSSNWDEDRELLFANDEDFCKTATSSTEKGFGYMRIYDWSDASDPVQVGEFKTPNSSGTTDPAGGDYTIHNTVVVGTDLYVSWYSDGVRVVDASDPTNPEEVAFFVPPAGHNPVKPSQRGVLSNTTQVWGVVVDEATGLVYASDMNTGLWILRRTD